VDKPLFSTATEKKSVGVDGYFVNGIALAMRSVALNSSIALVRNATPR
jgi:hypothetical protein